MCLSPFIHFLVCQMLGQVLRDPSEKKTYVPCYGLNMICPHQKSSWVLVPNIMLLRGGEAFHRHLEEQWFHSCSVLLASSLHSDSLFIGQSCPKWTLHFSPVTSISHLSGQKSFHLFHFLILSMQITSNKNIRKEKAQIFWVSSSNYEADWCRRLTVDGLFT